MIITTKRLQEILWIQERTADNNSALTDEQIEQNKILRAKLVELQKTEHLTELIKSKKQLQEKEKEITEFRKKMNASQAQLQQSETEHADHITEIAASTQHIKYKDAEI